MRSFTALSQRLKGFSIHVDTFAGGAIPLDTVCTKRPQLFWGGRKENGFNCKLFTDLFVIPGLTYLGFKFKLQRSYKVSGIYGEITCLPSSPTSFLSQCVLITRGINGHMRNTAYNYYKTSKKVWRLSAAWRYLWWHHLWAPEGRKVSVHYLTGAPVIQSICCQTVWTD